LNIEDINGWNAETMHTITATPNQTEKNISNLLSTLQNHFIFNRSIEIIIDECQIFESNQNIPNGIAKMMGEHTMMIFKQDEKTIALFNLYIEASTPTFGVYDPFECLKKGQLNTVKIQMQKAHCSIFSIYNL
jgi:hypothetical protein